MIIRSETMKVIISQHSLNQAIQHVSKAITSRSTIPILSGIKIDVDQTGVTLTASDTEISIQSFIATELNNKQVIKIDKEGSVVLPAKFFVEIIKKMPEEEIEIEVKSQFQTWIKSGTSELQMSGLDPEEYPLLPKIEENQSIQMNSDLLKSMIRETLFAISTNESTPILTGILWNFNEEVLSFVATDRHRLANRKADINKPIDFKVDNIVISGKTLAELYKIIPDQDANIEIVVTDNQVLFKINAVLFYSRILDGTYPDTSKIIPNDFKTELILNKKKFLDAMDRAYLLSREEKTNIVKMITKEDGMVEISSNLSELGKITEQIKVDSMQGEELKISFNSKYMLDALKIIESEKVHIGFTGAMSPIIIKPYQDDNMLHLILPYRTTS